MRKKSDAAAPFHVLTPLPENMGEHREIDGVEGSSTPSISRPPDKAENTTTMDHIELSKRIHYWFFLLFFCFINCDF